MYIQSCDKEGPWTQRKFLKVAILRRCDCRKNSNSMYRRFKFSEEETRWFFKKKPRNLKRVFELLTELSDDFMENGREQPPVQEREPF